MTPNDFGDALGKAANLFTPNDAVQLRILTELFASSTAATVATTLTKLRKARTFTPTAGQPAIGDVLTALNPLAEFVSPYGKPAFTKDLQAVTTFLQGFTQAGVRSFVDEAVAVLTAPTPSTPTLKEEVVQRHLRRLEQTLGDDPAFSAAYKELDDDPEVGKLEIAALVKRFTDIASKSRPAALKKIWARHHTLMTSKAKSEARGGRGAG
jgi:hypothetical protein